MAGYMWVKVEGMFPGGQAEASASVHSIGEMNRCRGFFYRIYSVKRPTMWAERGICLLRGVVCMKGWFDDGVLAAQLAKCELGQRVRGSVHFSYYDNSRVKEMYDFVRQFKRDDRVECDRIIGSGGSDFSCEDEFVRRFDAVITGEYAKVVKFWDVFYEYFKVGCRFGQDCSLDTSDIIGFDAGLLMVKGSD